MLSGCSGVRFRSLSPAARPASSGLILPHLALVRRGAYSYYLLKLIRMIRPGQTYGTLSEVRKDFPLSSLLFIPMYPGIFTYPERYQSGSQRTYRGVCPDSTLCQFRAILTDITKEPLAGA